MSKIDIRLLYQKNTGLSLDSIERHVGQTGVYEECECGESVYCTFDPELTEYIDWLEEVLEAALSVGEVFAIAYEKLLRNEAETARKRYTPFTPGS